MRKEENSNVANLKVSDSVIKIFPMLIASFPDLIDFESQSGIATGSL